MDFNSIIEKASDLLQEASFLNQIETEQEYHQALELMDHLFDDFEKHYFLIDVLAKSIKCWEDSSVEFEEFNAMVNSLDSDVAALRVLIDQHNLNLSDFSEEIGNKSLLSMIISGKRNLTAKQIQALSKRFNLDPGVFFNS